MPKTPLNNKADEKLISMVNSQAEMIEQYEPSEESEDSVAVKKERNSLQP